MKPPFSVYARAGLSCIPIRNDGSKAPAIGTWRQYQQRIASEQETTQWEVTHQGVAIIGGEVCGNLEIIDLDVPALVRSYLDAIKEQDVGLFEKLCLVRTPRRNESGQTGCHVLYRTSSKVTGNTKLAMTEPEPEFGDDGEPVLNPVTHQQNMKPRCLIETRGEGGYVVTVGSARECHSTGNLYEHVCGPKLTDLETLADEERRTLHATARTFDRSLAETHVEPSVRGYERSKPGESPGDDFNQRTSWAEILAPAGWQPAGETGGIKRWRRPGKSAGWSATTGILSKAGNELFTVFSANAHPFEGNNPNGHPGVCYSKFAAWSILNHGGNFGEAAKALVKMGYGTQVRQPSPQTKVIKATLMDAEKRYLDMLSRGDTEYISTGIPLLDKAIGGGMERGEMVVLGGLPSHGKSVCGLQALRYAAEHKKHGVLVSHEMGGMAVAKRMIQSRTSMNTTDWYMNVSQLQEDMKLYWSLCGQIYLLEQCRSIETIEAEVGQIAAERELSIVVIDHAQLTDGKGGTRYEQITNASGRFKALAVKHECACMVLSQLNRKASYGEAPTEQNLKESGALEQDADVVILVRWPWKSDPDNTQNPGKYIMSVKKNRNRPIVHWEVEGKFEPAHQRITAELPTPMTDRFDEVDEDDDTKW